MEFNIGDKVKHRESKYKFEIVFINGNHYMIYSKEMSHDDIGHDGTSRNSKYLGNGDSKGHHYASKDHLAKIETGEKPKFSIGDEVMCIGEKFIIVEIISDNNIIIFSKDWAERGRGHDGILSCYEGNGHKYGHYYSTKERLTIIKSKNEVFGTNPNRCPRGIESKVYSEPIKPASASRPIGSPAADIGIECRVATGSLNNNQLQFNSSR